LFKPVQVPQKVPFGTDPKTVLCQYFKSGNCERGAKCKFSHDLNIGRKVEKKDLYTDDRAEGISTALYLARLTKLEHRYYGYLGSTEIGRSCSK
jgi:hypothetical protein